MAPVKYDGEPAKCWGFLLQFELFVTSQGELTDSHKVVILLTFLTGQALTWATTIWEKGGETIAHFLAMFNHAPGGREVGERMLSRSQGRQSVVEYALHSQNEWNEPALKAAFQHSLNSNVLAELAHHDDIATVNLLIDMSIKIDNLLRDRHSTLGVFPAIEHPPAEPMQLGMTRLSPHERVRRRKERLCFCCGQTNHCISQCAARPQCHSTEPNAETLGVSSFILQSVPLCSIDMIMEYSDVCSVLPALIESGYAGDFFNLKTARELQIPLIKIKSPIKLNTINGSQIGTGLVTHHTPAQHQGTTSIRLCHIG